MKESLIFLFVILLDIYYKIFMKYGCIYDLCLNTIYLYYINNSKYMQNDGIFITNVGILLITINNDYWMYLYR